MRRRARRRAVTTEAGPAATNPRGFRGGDRLDGDPPDPETRIALAAVREDGARLGDLTIAFACLDQAMLDHYGKEPAS